MTRKEFESIRPALLNDDWIPWDKWHKSYKDSMRDIPYEHVQIISAMKGVWIPLENDSFYPGCIYRINPNWEGPEVPVEPAKPKYVDYKIFFNKSVYRFTNDEKTDFYLTTAPAVVGFAGYVYFIGTPSESVVGQLIFTTQSEDKTIRLMVPDAVRFIKS